MAWEQCVKNNLYFDYCYFPLPDYFRSLQRKKLEETVDTYYCDDSFDFTGIVNKIGRDMVKHRIRAIISLLISLLLSFFSARMFLKMRQAESIVPGEGVSHVGLLSDYFPGIKNHLTAPHEKHVVTQRSLF